jgi:hypothetical protein
MTAPRRLLDHLLSPRHLAFWALLGSVATVVGLVITIGMAVAGGAREASTPPARYPITPIGTAPTSDALSTPTATASETTTTTTGSVSSTGSTSPSEVRATNTADLTVQSVNVEVSDTYKVGAGLYQRSGRKTINLRYWWTTVTNYGPIAFGDKTCTVVTTITAIATNSVIDTFRTAECTYNGGWVEMSAPQGWQRILVDVTLANGSQGKGTFDFNVIP